MKLVISEKPLNVRGEGGGAVSFDLPFVFDGAISFVALLGAGSLAIRSPRVCRLEVRRDAFQQRRAARWP